jgi:hypothetical protein
MITSRTILLLDKVYTPLMFITRRKALCMVYVGKAEFLMDEQVVRLLVRIVHNPDKFRSVRRRRGTFGVKSSIFLRDGDICQYCGRSLSKRDRTLDHIIPKSKGGTTSFLNCVTACIKCNQQKGDRAAHEAGLTLRCKPYIPTQTELLRALDKNNVYERFMEWLNTGMGYLIGEDEPCCQESKCRP